jgi:hypothetical protein
MAFVHAWHEPDWKIGKEPKKTFLASAENCGWAAPDAAWRKERTNLLPDNTVEQRYIDDTRYSVHWSFSELRILLIFAINIVMAVRRWRDRAKPRAGIYVYFRR